MRLLHSVSLDKALEWCADQTAGQTDDSREFIYEAASEEFHASRLKSDKDCQRCRELVAVLENWPREKWQTNAWAAWDTPRTAENESPVGTVSRDALVSVLLPSIESLLPTSTTVGQGGKAVDETNSPTPSESESVGSFEVKSEFVRICGLGEDVTLENTEGVQRLIAIVTAQTRRVAVMELARIGADQEAVDRGSIDLDADGLSGRESVNDDQFEPVLGDDALRGTDNEVGRLIAERGAALSAGHDDIAKQLTEQINASLYRAKSDFQKAARNVRKTLDRTIEWLRDKSDGKGTRLAKHFDDHVKRRPKESEFVYSPDESNQKFSWTRK